MKKLLHERLRENVEGHSLLDIGEVTGSGGHDAIWSSNARLLADEIERYYIPRPRFEDGTPLHNGDQIDYYGRAGTVVSYLVAHGVVVPYASLHLKCGATYNVPLDEPIKRPTPKVLDADGVEIKVGDTVYSIYNGSAMKVEQIRKKDKQLCGKDSVCCGGGVFFCATEFTHEKPVFDAEGVRICKGDTVYTKNGESAEVVSIHDENEWPTQLGGRAEKPFVRYAGDGWNFADEVSHREPDSIKRVRDYARKLADDGAYNEDELNEIADRLTALIERGA